MADRDLIMIVPSRGRPAAAQEFADAFLSTATARTRVIFAVDGDDPTESEYDAVATAGTSSYKTNIGDRSTMVRALNTVALHHAFLDDPPFAIGFCGDDHRPRTLGWDKLYLDALREMGTGIVYGNDLLQGENLPTQCAMTSDIIRALGWMSPPSLRHLAVDNWWKELGNGADCLRYLPEVIVEHMHPVAGKAKWDEGYIRVNAQSMYEHDLAELARLRRFELPGAINKVRECMAASAGGAR